MRFIIASRDGEIGSVSNMSSPLGDKATLLSHDDQKEIITALASMKKITVQFTEDDGQGFVKKGSSLYGNFL